MSLESKIDVSRFSRILVAPLDWGLGHATRCVPLIQFFLGNGIEVHLAGNGNSLEVLKQEFPELSFSELPGYNIQYAKNPNHFEIKMALQSPKLIGTIKKEHKAINQLIGDLNIDMILSDNRYGCYSPQAYSVFLGHQLSLQLPKSLSWVNRLNKWLINKFDECWIPDNNNETSLSGNLSRNIKGVKTRYIGPLSRFQQEENSSNIKYKYLAILSGPEPQKSVLADIIRSKFLSLNCKTAIVHGDPMKKSITQTENITSFNHLGSNDMNKIICESENVICRSGYSSIMDMVALSKPAYIIPTPGQTEQEYLANYLDGKYGFSKISQNELENFEFLN